MENAKRQHQAKDPQTKLFDRMLLQTSANRKHKTKNYTFSNLPGINKIRSQIEQYIIQPILNNDEYSSKKILLRGPCGVGKTFLLKCISNEYNIALIKTVANDLLASIERTRIHGKCIIYITDLNALEEKKDIIRLSDELSLIDNIFIVAEVSDQVDLQLRKYNCFEDEILFEVPSIKDRLEIFVNIYEKYLLTVEKDEAIDFSNVVNMTPGLVASDICKLSRKAILLSKTENKILKESHYLRSLSNSSTRQNLITFDDIGGLIEAKKELYNMIILPFLQREKYKKWGIRISGGILMHGPPGCGKTIIAKAIANLGHFNFISIKGPEVINKYVGNTEKAIREIFDSAKLQQPCVVFLDEIDSLCQKRGNTDFNNRIVNQLLTVMDGFDDRGEVFIIAATNRPELIDKAFLRPGRFDKILKIELPNYFEREEIFKKHTKNIEHECFDFEEIDTNGFSGADIQGFVKQACINFLIDSSQFETVFIPKKYFIDSVNDYKKSKGLRNF